VRADDASYFRLRALEEQVAAQHAKSPGARDRHEELATLYRSKATMASRRAALPTDFDAEFSEA
jgi:hypothetical protein